jgi:hypothetical protein
MPPEDEPDSPREPDERAIREARAMFEHAEAAWQRQLEGEQAAASASGSSRLWRTVLLGAAIIALLFLLLQHLA